MPDLPDKVPSPNGQGDLTLNDVKEAAREFGHKVVPDHMIVTEPPAPNSGMGDKIADAIRRGTAVRPF